MIPTSRIPSPIHLVLSASVGLSLPLAAHPLTFNSEVTYGSTQPVGAPASISNWTGATFDADNIGGSGVNADGGSDNGAANDDFTYVANNRPVQGQSFVTGGNSNGYQLDSFTVQAAGYNNSNASGANVTYWNLNEHIGPILLTLVKIEGTTRTTIVRYCFKGGGNGNPGSGSSANGSGKFITFEMPSTTYLDPDSTYGFEIAVGNGSSNHFEWLGSQSDNYSDGTAYHYSGTTITPLTGDRVFQADMSALAAPAPGFAHPGTLHSQADLDRMKAKVQANEEPWLSGYNKLLSSLYNNLGWPAYNVDYIVRGGAGNNYTRSQQDAQLIYTLAMIWHVTGDTTYADRAVYIANTWSDLIGLQGDTNRSLAAGICGYLFAIGGDLLSTYPGWPEAEKQAYKDMMMRVFYPENLDFLWRHHDTLVTKGGNTHYRLNWDTANMASMAAIGILCDNRAVYDQAVDFFKYGPGNGRVERAAWYIHPNGLGQGEEAGRDQGHNMGGWYAMSLLCQMAWNQGDDLFAWDDNRVLRAFEYNAKYNLGNDVPYARHRNCSLTYSEGSVSGAGRGIGQYYQWELVYNHYVNVKGIAAPWSEQAAAATRPEPWPNTAYHPSQVDWFGLGTLAYSQEPATSGIAPGNLVGHWSENQITLNWNGTATATGYDIKRATTPGGPYTTVGSSSSSDLYYVDDTVSNGASYYYKVTANTPSGSLDSSELEVAQQLVTHYTFEGNANDQVGTRNAELFGGSSGVPGYATGFGGGQAIDLDGADDYVKMPVGTANHQDITIATWVYWDGGSNWQRIFDFGSDIEKTLYMTPSNGSGMEVGFTTTRWGNFYGDAAYRLTGPSMPVGTWTHVAFTLNGDTMTLYVNGVPVDSEFNDLIDPLHGQPFCYLGRSMWNADPYFNGRIDDFRIYNYGLTGDEVYSLWGQGGANNPPTFTTDPILPAAADEDANYSGAGVSLATFSTDLDGGGLTYAKVTGPGWLAVAANGALSGSPTNDDVGENHFVVRVTDPSGATDDANLYITVNNSNDAPVWSQDPIDGGVLTSGESIGISVAPYATDVDAGDNLSFSKVAGPTWLIVGADGTLAGSPGSGDIGLNSFTLRATDLASASTDVQFTVQVLSSSLLRVHYPFENDTFDSKNGFDGVATGSPVYAAGQVGDALVFDGVDDLVTLPAGAINYENLTIATWVNWDGGGNYQRIFDFGNGTNQYLFLTPNTGSGMRFAIKNGGAEQTVTTTALPTGQWVHVAVTLDGDTATLFVNGFPMASNIRVTINPSDFNPGVNYIGDSQFGGDPLFSGKIDEFRIYNYALGADEIASLAGVATPPFATVAHWTFEEGTANTYVPGPAGNGTYIGSMLDVSGNGNHLSPWNGTTFYYRSTVPSGTTPQSGAANTRSIQNANSFPSSTTVGTRINGWSPAKWTIEATIRPDNVSGVKTMVGRDSRYFPASTNYSVLYFELVDSALHCRFNDATGTTWEVTSASGAITATNWQAVAATSDGSTLAIYKKNLTAGEPSYTLLGSTDISASTNPALAIGASDGADWNAGEFSVGRGLEWGGVHGRRFLGYLDNIRLSNIALGTGEFLHSNPPAAPGSPTSLSATTLSSSQITLAWAPVTGATHYIVSRSETTGGPYTAIATAVTGTEFSDSGLSPNVTYHYVVTAVNSGGTSADSPEADATTPPETPTGLNAIGTSLDQIDLNWDVAGGAESYTLKRSTTPGGPYTILASGLTGTSYSDSGLTEGATYYYVVVAVTSTDESEASAEAFSTTIAPVAYWNFEEGSANTYVPYGPGTAGQYDGSILDVSGNGNHLSAWDDNWHWYRANVPAATTPRTGTSNTLSIQNANGFPAMSAIGTSLTAWSPTQWTIEAAIRPDDATSGYQTFVGRDSQGAYAGDLPLSALYFQVRPDGSLRIQFTDTAGNKWETASAANAVQDAKWHAVAATSDGNTLSLYLKNLTDGDATYALVGTADISASANPAISTGAGDGASWDPGVFTIGRGLFNGNHTDRFFGHLDDIRLSEVALGQGQFLYSSPPPVPSGLTATTISTSEIDLTWSTSAGATGYNLKRSASSGGPFASIASGITGTGYNDTGLTEGTSYFYVVSANNLAGESPDSDEAGATTASILPGEPTALSAHAASENSIDLAWTAATGADTYIVSRSDSPGGPYTPVATGIIDTTCTDSSLDPFTTYYYVVRGENAGGEGPDSNEASATTESVAITDEEVAAVALSFANIAPGSADLGLDIDPSVPGHTYQIEYSPDLSPGSWQNVGTAQPGNGAALHFSVPISITDGRGFYRTLIAR